MADAQPIAWRWVGISLVVYFACELVLGWLVGDLIAGAYLSGPTRYRIQVVMILASYLGGGIVVGFVSPGLRLIEPAIGAALSVALSFVIGLFTPNVFVAFQLDRIFWGGLVAFGVALFGAHLGERWSGNGG